MQLTSRKPNVLRYKELMDFGGTVAEIALYYPGCQLCDGTNGTPDLRDTFIICARQDDAGTAKTNVTGSLTKSGGTATAQFDVPINVSGAAGAIYKNTTPPYGEGDAFTTSDGVGGGSGESVSRKGVLTKSRSIMNPYYAACKITRTADWS